jgi:hypothetical protein
MRTNSLEDLGKRPRRYPAAAEHMLNLSRSEAHMLNVSRSRL